MTTTRPPLLGAKDLPQFATISMEGFLGSVRKHVRGLPLTITLHGWGSDQARTLLDDLAHVRERGDAIWVVTKSDPPDRVATEREDIVVLNCDYPTNLLIFRNLVVDVALFCAAADDELDDADTLRSRCSVMLVHDEGPLAETLLRIAREHGIAACSWHATRVRIQSPLLPVRRTRRRQSPPPAQPVP